jgi:antitoxin component YwqK of YwqJK toxin-antitoxin module
MRRLFGVGLMAMALTAACAQPAPDPAKLTTNPTYDKTTGKLTQLTYDRNGNGVIDTWTDMDGARPLRSRIDLDEDGKIDRWEYYDDQGKLLKVGMSRSNNGKADAWVFSGPDGKVARVEISSTADEQKIDRWEYYDASGLVRVEEDTNGDGRVDKWETYENGVIRTAEFDEDGDGKRDRRLTYKGGALELIESEPDTSGHYAKRVVVQ